MRLYTADVLFNGQSMLRDAGVVADADGTILAVGDAASLRASTSDHVAVQVLMPGVINAHTHLTDAEIETPVPGGDSLPEWVGRLLTARQTQRTDRVGVAERADSGPVQTVAHDAVADVIARMHEAGTVAVGEVANGTATLRAIRESRMHTVFIQELVAFRAHLASTVFQRAVEVEASEHWDERVRPTIGIHAPYSVSPALARLIVAHNTRLDRITHIHLTEDPEERALFKHGNGKWRDYLEEHRVWDSEFTPPGISPIDYYDQLGLLSPQLAAVHLADATVEEIGLIARRGVRVILSPTSNEHIGNRVPPLDAIVNGRIPFALGTDGRGSNPGIDVFAEARLLAERFEWVDGMILLRALTANGADVLGFSQLGRIEIGRSPGLVAIELADAAGTDSEIGHRMISESLTRTRLC